MAPSFLEASLTTAVFVTWLALGAFLGFFSKTSTPNPGILILNVFSINKQQQNRQTVARL
jgi:hypothetical protein